MQITFYDNSNDNYYIVRANSEFHVIKRQQVSQPGFDRMDTDYHDAHISACGGIRYCA